MSWENSGIRKLIRKIYISQLKQRLHREKEVTFLPGSDISKNTIIAGKCTIAGKVLNSKLEGGNVVYGDMNDSSLGYGSFVAPYTTLEFCEIGRFCSIGRYVHIVRGQHPTNTFVSTSPCFYSLEQQAGFTYVKEQKFDDYKFLDQNKKVAVKIGNDVWVGTGAIILEGVTIGDGAVIAAGAVVTKDVAPYAIVGGVPAHLIRYRHTEEQRDKLLKIQWWNKDLGYIKEHSNEFEDVNAFLKNYSES